MRTIPSRPGGASSTTGACGPRGCADGDLRARRRRRQLGGDATRAGGSRPQRLRCRRRARPLRGSRHAPSRWARGATAGTAHVGARRRGLCVGSVAILVLAAAPPLWLAAARSARGRPRSRLPVRVRVRPHAAPAPGRPGGGRRLRERLGRARDPRLHATGGPHLRAARRRPDRVPRDRPRCWRAPALARV